MQEPNKNKEWITRFAPSPTGRLHLGHAYSALFAYKLAQESGGKFIVRIEDIDPSRCTPENEQGILEDMEWLGLEWELPVRRQSDFMEDYKAALKTLQDKDLLYPCFCTRKEIKEEIERSGTAPHSPEGFLYPGKCKHLSQTEQEDKIAAGTAYAFRLDMDKAIDLAGPLTWVDHGKGTQKATPDIMGDVVLARKDIMTSYHLSVTLDDHLQGITLVSRGEELFYASHLHRLIQTLLDLDVPEWHHHKIITHSDGTRLAKRDGRISLQQLRHEGVTPAEIMDRVGLTI